MRYVCGAKRDIYNRSMDIRCVNIAREIMCLTNAPPVYACMSHNYVDHKCVRAIFFCVCAVADTKCDLLLSFTPCPVLLSSLPSPAGFLVDVKNAVVKIIYYQRVCQVPGYIPKSHIPKDNSRHTLIMSVDYNPDMYYQLLTCKKKHAELQGNNVRPLQPWNSRASFSIN